MKTPGMLAKLAVVIAIASGAGAFAPALPSLAHVTSAATSIIAPNHCRLSGSSFGAQRHAGRETLSLRMTGKETPLSKVVADVSPLAAHHPCEGRYWRGAGHSPRNPDQAKNDPGWIFIPLRGA